MVLSDDLIWLQVSLSAKEITEKKIPYKSLRQHFFLVFWQKLNISCGRRFAFCGFLRIREWKTLFKFYNES